MTCPITNSCFQQTWDLYDISSGLFDDQTPELARVKFTLEGESPDMTTQRLRAFYILETVHSQVLFSAVHHTGVELSDDLAEPFERTEEGLSALRSVLEEAQKSLRVEAGELELMGKTENPGMEMLVGVLGAPLRVVAYALEMIDILKPALRSEKSLQAIGALFSKCLRAAGYSIEQCLDQLQTLLSITPHNPIRPWNTTTSFQV